MDTPVRRGRQVEGSINERHASSCTLLGDVVASHVGMHYILGYIVEFRKSAILLRVSLPACEAGLRLRFCWAPALKPP